MWAAPLTKCHVDVFVVAVIFLDHMLGSITAEERGEHPRKQLWQLIPEAVWAEESEQRPNFYKETFMKSKYVYSFKILISPCAVIPEAFVNTAMACLVYSGVITWGHIVKNL